MRIRLAVEDIEAQHWVAWAVDLLGCTSSARSSRRAVRKAPQAIVRYFLWRAECDPDFTIPTGPVEVELCETFHAYPSRKDPDYLVNAFFEDDRRPLTSADLALARRLLGSSREHLLRIVRGLPPGRLEQPIGGELRGSLAGILKHIAGAENWYFGMLDLGLPRDRLEANAVELLEAVRRNTLARLGTLCDEPRITENCEELWSARKVLRRTLWHERDHLQQIETYLQG